MSSVPRVVLALAMLVLAGCTGAPPPTSPAPTAPPPAAPAPASPPPPPPPPAEPAFEVWLVDQADTASDGGGMLHVYRSSDLAAGAASARAEEHDLGGAARDLCLNQTGSAPRRPHMLVFSGPHAVLAFVASGHVLFLDAATRAPAGCVDVGAQAHAAFAAPDGSAVLVANQNGKLLQRIRVNDTPPAFTLDDAATLNLTACATPTGAPCEAPDLRPDNAPICPVLDRSGRWAFVTLRGGGLFVVDAQATPMRVVAEYDHAAIHPNGCGGVEAGGTMYVTSGGGTAANPLEADLYAIPLAALPPASPAANTPAPRLVFRQDDRPADLHGAFLTPDGRWLWLGDRNGNRLLVVDARNGTLAGEVALAGNLSGDPAPDLMDVAPGGRWAFAALRGPAPLTGNAPAVNNSVGATPGLAVFRIVDGGRAAEFAGLAAVSRIVNGTQVADPHAVRVRAV